MALDTLITFPVQIIKQKMIWENVYKSVSRRKLTMKRKKERNSFVKPIVYVYYMTLDNCLLFGHETFQQ